jgi:hypothetical protein
MYSWAIKRIVGFLYGKVSAGDLRLPLLGVAKDAVLIFPGDSSFGGEQRGKPAIEAWMRRFASLRPEFTVKDAAAAGQRVKDITLNGAPVEPGRTYRVTMNSFLASGGDNFTVFNEGTNTLGGEVDTDALEAYFRANSPVAPGPRNHQPDPPPSGSAAPGASAASSSSTRDSSAPRARWLALTRSGCSRTSRRSITPRW